MTLNIELGKSRTDGACKVYVLISSSSGKKRLPTNIFLGDQDYVMSRGVLKILNRKKEFAISKLLMDLESDIMNNASLALVGDDIGADAVKNMLLEKVVSSDFFAFADEWISTCRLKGKKNYVTTINCFKLFVNKERLSFTEMTPSLLMRFQNSLNDRPRAQSMYMAALRKLWNEAERMFDEDLPRSPFRRINIVKQKPKGQRATDIDTVHKIFEYKGRGRRAVLARDGFILSFCLMGMNAVDLYGCTSMKDGTLSYNRAKVKDRRRDNAHTEIELHPFIDSLIEKYKDRTKGKHVFRFYKMYKDPNDFGRAMNIGLKKILGDDTDVTFYTARHTWATIARNDLGADKSTVNDALVHVDREMSVTDLYIKKNYRLINELNKKVIDYVFAKYMKK